ncbi:MAG: class I SAM-dependent methyltransferase [Thermonemataceae bacterium]
MFQQIRKQIQAFNAKNELKKFAPQLREEAEELNAEQLIDLIDSEKWQRFFWIKQVRTEILALCQLIEARKPRFLLEIGTANGGSLFLFSKLAHPEATIISIDLPDGLYGGGYPAYRQAFYESFVSEQQRMVLHRANSHEPQTLQQVKDLLQGNPLDFLFIDGDHRYEGVKKDFKLYAPLVKEGGLISFHDIAEHPEGWQVGVGQYWHEIKNDYQFQEFIGHPTQGWAGIGVIEK